MQRSAAQRSSPYYYLACQTAGSPPPSLRLPPQVRILACKFMDAAGYGYTSDAIACINYCASKGARVINASWGGATTPNQAMIDAINAAGAAGALFVNSAGNNNQQDLDASVSYPPSYKLPTQLVVASVG